MVFLLPLFVSVLLVGVEADIKILNTPDGNMGSEPCVRACSGVDNDFAGWTDSGYNPGKVLKYIRMPDCDFVSAPVITAVSGGGVGNSALCPSFTVSHVQSFGFKLYSSTDFTSYKMAQHKCMVYWTATGFTC